MDAKLEQWFHKSLDYYHNLDNSRYNILEIIIKSIKLMVDYAYEHCLPITEYCGNMHAGVPEYEYHAFKMPVEPGVRIELMIYRYHGRISQIMIDGYTTDFRGTEGRVSESCSDHDGLEDDAALYIVHSDLKKIIQYILDNQDMNAYFLVQGINVKNYLHYYE